MSKSIHYHGLYRLKIEIKNLIKQTLKINPKPIRDTDYVNEIYRESEKKI